MIIGKELIYVAYNSDRKGYETKDGGLIRVNGDESEVRIDIYEGNEREHGGHTWDTIRYNTDTGKGTIDQHNEDKSEKSSTDISCFLTTACIRYFKKTFDDNCYELQVLRWFRDSFVSLDDKEHYYEIAPVIVNAINELDNADVVYEYIYTNIVHYCVCQIEQRNYDNAYNRYKNGVLELEERFARPVLEKRLIRILKLVR